MKNPMKLIFHIFVGVVLAFGIVLDGMAEENYLFEHLSTEDGLSHGSVSGMLKDRKGFMWFATWDGINQYDGNVFKTYKPASEGQGSAASNRIASMQEDALGNIWVFTYDQKLYRLDRFTGTFDLLPAMVGQEKEIVINDMYPASNGDVWILTANAGIFRVISNPESNEFRLQHFHTKSNPALLDNAVHWLFEDHQQNCWIKTANGLNCFRFQAKTNTFSQHEFSLSAAKLINGAAITTIFQAPSALYLGRSDGKILKLKSPDDLPGLIDLELTTSITAISASPDNKIFAGTSGKGVFVYDKKRDQLLHHFRDEKIRKVLKFFPDSKGRMWVESDQAGIAMIEPQSWSFHHFTQKLDVSPDLRSHAQCGLMEDQNGTLWLTLKGGGFGYYNEASESVDYFFNEPGNPESKISNFVNCFYSDTSGVLWMSTYFRGIEKVTTITPQFELTQPAPQSNLSIANEVRALLTDSHGILWVATKNQELYLYNQQLKLIHKIEQLNGQKIGRVYALLEDHAGNIYVGTKGNGLFVLYRDGKLKFRAEHHLHRTDDVFSLSDNNIYALYEDVRHRIWIGTYGGGVNVFHDGQFFHPGNQFKDYPLAKASRVRHMAGDQHGNIWIGTTKGLVLVQTNPDKTADVRFRYFDPDQLQLPGLKGNDLLWIYPGADCTIWLASMGGGLARLISDPDSSDVLNWKSYTRNEGLSSDVVFTIVSDAAGTLWMSTENGIASYQPDSNIFRHYNRYDGIVSSGFSESAVATLADGRICMGASNGVYTFDPASLSSGLNTIPIEWSSFQLFGNEVVPGKASVLQKTISETSSVQLKHHQNALSISWSALDFKMQEKLQFDYRLKGYDEIWHHLTSQPKVAFNKLPPGKYVLEVRFSNNELQEINPVKQLRIEILPPFWKTRLAYGLYALFVFIVLFFAWRIARSMIRLRNKVVIERELSNLKIDFFTNISHELRTPLTLILGPAGELKKNEPLSEKGKSYLAMIEQNTHRMLGLVNQLLDFRKVQSRKMELELQQVNLSSLVNRVSAGFEQMAKDRNIALRVQGCDDPLPIQLDEEKMEGVLYNLLSNAMKFTPPGGRVLVKVVAGQQEVSIAVQDNGPGISEEHRPKLFEVFASADKGTGLGLALSRSLVELHGGALTYRPTPDGGATFCIQLNKVSINAEGLNEAPVSLVQGEPEYSAETAYPEKAASLRPRLLVADDNPELGRLLRMQLEAVYEIVEAADGIEAWELASDRQPDLLLSDVMMPRMDGIQLLEKMKNHSDTSHIPVVLLTARSSVESRIEGLQYGADAYLTKPYHPDQLRAQLANLLRQRELLRQRFTRRMDADEAEGTEHLTNPDVLFLKQVREIIRLNLTNTEFKMDDIYREMGMGRSKFSDKIKGLTGLSPIEMVMEIRLNKARELLLTGTYNVSETSYLSGFTDAGYFSKCYKEHFGVLPSQEVKK